MKFFGLFIATGLICAGCLSKKQPEIPGHTLVVQSLQNYGKSVKIQKKYIQFTTFETVGKKNATYSITFVNNIKESLKNARILGVNMVEDFFNMLKNDSDIQEAIKERCKDPDYSKEITLENIACTMKFQDKKGNWTLPPSIAKIQFEDGTFYYYEALPATDDMNVVYEESYEEAVEFRDNQKAIPKKLEPDYSTYPKPENFKY